MTAWTLLAFVSAVITSGGAATTLAAMVLMSVAFALFMAYAVRPSLARLLDSTRRADALSKEHIALVLAVLLLSALATEVIGIHALFGAFLAGVVMPADTTSAACCENASRRSAVSCSSPCSSRSRGFARRLGCSATSTIGCCFRDHRGRNGWEDRRHGRRRWLDRLRGMNRSPWARW